MTLPAKSHRIRRSRRLLALAGLALLVQTAPALADTRFCGGPAQPTTPDDLDNVEGDLTLQYVASRPAGPVTCAAGYLLEKCGDHETANKVFDKCIAAGYVGSMIWKALMYENGNGVPKDPVKATELLHRAAVSGDPNYAPLGKLHYATALYQGSGVERNVEEAMKWFREAAAEGNEDAREFLRTGHHTAVRDVNGVGVGPMPGTATAAPSAAPAANAPVAVPAVKARKLEAAADKPTARQPERAPPPASVEAVPQIEVQGQRLDKVAAEPPPEHEPSFAPWLLVPVLLAFLGGLLRQSRPRRTPVAARPAGLPAVTPPRPAAPAVALRRA